MPRLGGAQGGAIPLNAGGQIAEDGRHLRRQAFDRRGPGDLFVNEVVIGGLDVARRHQSDGAVVGHLEQREKASQASSRAPQEPQSPACRIVDHHGAVDERCRQRLNVRREPDDRRGHPGPGGLRLVDQRRGAQHKAALVGAHDVAGGDDDLDHALLDARHRLPDRGDMRVARVTLIQGVA